MGTAWSSFRSQGASARKGTRGSTVSTLSVSTIAQVPTDFATMLRANAPARVCIPHTIGPNTGIHGKGPTAAIYQLGREPRTLG
jgi:hypothetical protein